MLPLLNALLVFPPGTTPFPGGNNTSVSPLLCSRFRRETFALKTQPWKGWSVIFSMCEAHAVAFALLLLLHLLWLLPLILLLLFRDAVRHFLRRAPAPRRNALQPAATLLAGFGPRRAPVGTLAGLLMRS